MTCQTFKMVSHQKRASSLWKVSAVLSKDRRSFCLCKGPSGRGRQERGAKLVWLSASNEWQPLKTCEPSLSSEPKPNCGMRAHQLSRSKDFYTFNALSSGLILSARHCCGTVPVCNMPLLLVGCHCGRTWYWSSPGRVVGRENRIFQLQSHPAATSRERVLITQDVQRLKKRRGLTH